MEKNSFLTLVKASSRTKGTITRRRKTTKKLEESVIDFFVICDKLDPYLECLVIDEDKENVLTNYKKKKGNVYSTDSDHHTLVMNLKLKYVKCKNERKLVYDVKNVENQKIFSEVTTFTKELSECFNDEKPLEEQTKAFSKTFFKLVRHSFPKVRINDKPKETEVSKLISRRNLLKQNIKSQENQNLKKSVEDEILNLEKKICDLVSDDNMKNFIENFDPFFEGDSNFNTNAMWKVQRKISPKNNVSLPTAKLDEKGRFVSSPNEPKEHTLRHFSY